MKEKRNGTKDDTRLTVSHRWSILPMVCFYISEEEVGSVAVDSTLSSVQPQALLPKTEASAPCHPQHT